MRALSTLLAGLTLCLIASCSKPSSDDCRKAIANIQKLNGIENSDQAPDPEAAVRKCRAQSSKKAVKCTINAKTAAEAEACNAGKR
jgi:hypothetical protein